MGQYGDRWEAYYNAWKSDDAFWQMLIDAKAHDTLSAPTTHLPTGVFGEPETGSSGFSFFAFGHQLHEYQGFGPYSLNGVNVETKGIHPVGTSVPWLGKTWRQPIYDYSSGIPIYTGWTRSFSYKFKDYGFNPWEFDSIPYLLGAGAALLVNNYPELAPYLGPPMAVASMVTFLNNAVTLEYSLTVNYSKASIRPQNAPAPIWQCPLWQSR